MALATCLGVYLIFSTRVSGRPRGCLGAASSLLVHPEELGNCRVPSLLDLYVCSCDVTLAATFKRLFRGGVRSAQAAPNSLPVLRRECRHINAETLN